MKYVYFKHIFFSTVERLYVIYDHMDYVWITKSKAERICFIKYKL